MGEEELSHAVRAKAAYDDVYALEVWAIRDHRSSGKAELLDAINELESKRQVSFTGMNEALKAAGLGEFPWTPREKLEEYAAEAERPG